MALIEVDGGQSTDLDAALSAVAVDTPSLGTATSVSCGDRIQLQGTGFGFDAAGRLVSGEITGATVLTAGLFADEALSSASFSGLALSVPDAIALGGETDPAASLLGGGNVVSGYGSSFAGFGGDDLLTVLGSVSPAQLASITDPNEIHDILSAPIAVDGGAGVDTLSVDAFRDAVDIVGGGGTESLVEPNAVAPLLQPTINASGVEQLQFLDGTVYEDAISAAAQADLVYRAITGQDPGAMLLGQFAQEAQASGTTALAADILASPAGAAVTAGLSDAAFVTRLYQTLYGRDPDPGGQAAWTSSLDDGQNSRAVVVANFAGSAEAQALYGGVYGSGQIFAASPNAVEVLRGYETVQGRLPDLSGFTGFTEELDNGTLMAGAMYGILVSSSEFMQRLGGATDNASFVDLIQLDTSGSVDPNATSYWSAQLAAGSVTRGAVAEAYAHTAAMDAKIAPFVTATGILHGG